MLDRYHHPKREGTVERSRFLDLLHHIRAQGATVRAQQLGVQAEAGAGAGAGAEATVQGELIDGPKALLMKITQGNQLDTDLLVHEYRRERGLTLLETCYATC